MIRTNRCQLNILNSADWNLVVELYTNPKVRQFLGGVVDLQTIRQKFLQILKSDTQTQHWVVRVRENSRFARIGIVSLGKHHNNIDTEISYQFLPQWWNKGYAGESVKAIITYGLTVLKLPIIIAETQIDNVASCRLLESVGMTLEQTVERFGAKQGIFTT